MRTINFTRTKGAQLPAIWESGGGMTNTGSSRLVTRADGNKPTAVYMPTGGQLSCGEHALIPIQVGYHVIECSVGKGTRITVYRITSILADGDKAELEKLFEYAQGEWVDGNKPQGVLMEAAQASQKKACSYHCRSVFWAVRKQH
jgi:hypothetical protein